MTKLVKWSHPKTGAVRRIYIERPGLKAKLWLEKGDGGPSSFDVRFYGNEGDFSVAPAAGEKIQVREAREALAELGLDINSCTWEQLVAKTS